MQIFLNHRVLYLNMKKIWLAFIFLFLISLASASETVTLHVDETYLYKTATITLLDVGSKGSAYIRVNSLPPVRLYTGGSSIQAGLKLSVIDSFYSNIKEDKIATLKIEQVAECFINQDCDDNNVCTRDLCTLQKCYNEHAPGCILGNDCVEYGTITIMADKQFYCNIDDEWMISKAGEEKCDFDYECKTKLCSNALCVREVSGKIIEKGGEKMAPIWILIVIGGLIILKSCLLILWPENMKYFLNNLRLTPIGFRIVGILTFIIGVALVLWAVWPTLWP